MTQTRMSDRKRRSQRSITIMIEPLITPRYTNSCPLRIIRFHMINVSDDRVKDSHADSCISLHVSMILWSLVECIECREECWAHRASCELECLLLRLMTMRRRGGFILLDSRKLECQKYNQATSVSAIVPLTLLVPH